MAVGLLTSYFLNIISVMSDGTCSLTTVGMCTGLQIIVCLYAKLNIKEQNCLLNMLMFGCKMYRDV